MKKLLLSCVALATMCSLSAQKLNAPADWNDVPTLSEPATTPSLKVQNTDDTFWYMIKAKENFTSSLDDKYPTVFIDADRDNSTGTELWQWKQASWDYKFTTGYNDGSKWVSLPVTLQNNIIEAAIPHEHFNGAVALGAEFGFGLYYGDEDFYLPATNMSLNWAFAYPNLYCVKQRTIDNVSSTTTLFASNAYYHPFMGDISEGLNFYQSVETDTCFWASWAINLAPGKYDLTAATKRTDSSTKLIFSLVNMATNAVVSTYSKELEYTAASEGDEALGTWDLSAVPAGKYMLKVKRDKVWSQIVIKSLTLANQNPSAISEVASPVFAKQNNGCLQLTSVQKMNVTIYSLQGAKVAESRQVTAAAFELAKGVYLIKTDINGAVATQKIIIR